VDHVDLEAPLEERLQPGFVAAGVEQVGDDHDHAGPRGPRRVGGERRVQVGGAAAFEAAEEREERGDPAAPADRRPALGEPLAQDPDADALEAREADEAERRRDPGRPLQLGRCAPVHRGRGVDEEVQTEILVVDEELHVQPVAAGEDVPVDVAQVVADAVGPVVAELDAAARTPAAAVARGPAAHRPPADEREPLELREELRGQELAGGRRVNAHSAT
jgi:hypothetical protein